jgi:hypothetical protein
VYAEEVFLFLRSELSYDLTWKEFFLLQRLVRQVDNESNWPCRKNQQRNIAMSETINVALTLEQLEVIADALEFTGQCIEEEINDTAEDSEERRELVADLEEVATTLEVVASAMDTLVGTEEE